MAKGRKTGGRQKGSINKTTASVKAALVEAFEKRGGVTALLVWAETEPTEFYKLWGRLAPAELALTGHEGGPLEVKVRIVREGRRTTAS